MIVLATFALKFLSFLQYKHSKISELPGLLYSLCESNRYILEWLGQFISDDQKLSFLNVEV